MNKDVLYNRIKTLADKQNLSIRRLEEKLGFGNGVINRWRKTTPGIDKVEAVANFFGVTTDYLLGRESKADMVHNMTVDEALGTVMSFDGKPVTDHDKKVMKDLLESYLRNRD